LACKRLFVSDVEVLPFGCFQRQALLACQIRQLVLKRAVTMGPVCPRVGATRKGGRWYLAGLERLSKTPDLESTGRRKGCSTRRVPAFHSGQPRYCRPHLLPSRMRTHCRTRATVNVRLLAVKRIWLPLVHLMRRIPQPVRLRHYPGKVKRRFKSINDFIRTRDGSTPQGAGERMLAEKPRGRQSWREVAASATDGFLFPVSMTKLRSRRSEIRVSYTRSFGQSPQGSDLGPIECRADGLGHDAVP